MKKLNFAICSFNSTLLLLQTIHIITSTNKILLMSAYGPMMGFSCFVIFQALAQTVYEKTVLELLCEFYSLYWPLDNVNPGKFLKQFRFLYVISFVTGGMFITSVLLVSPVFKNEKDIFLIREMFHNWGQILEVVFWAGLFFQTVWAILIACVLAYAIFGIKFQLSLLLYQIKGMKGLRHQSMVKEKLHSVIRRHVCLTGFVRKVVKTYWGLLQVEVCMFLVVNISMLFFFINSFSRSDWQHNLRPLCITVTSFMLTTCLIVLCLQIPDMTGRIFDTTLELPWHLWNSKNRRTLLIFMTNSVQPIYINILGLGRLNSSSVSEYVKMIYSTTTVLCSLREGKK
ncbi:odorant receptor 43a [Tribolium castaneum]